MKLAKCCLSLDCKNTDIHTNTRSLHAFLHFSVKVVPTVMDNFPLPQKNKNKRKDKVITCISVFQHGTGSHVD